MVCVLATVGVTACGGGSNEAGISVSEQATLLRLAERIATAAGDPHPYDIQVVRTSQGAIARLRHEGIGRHDAPLYILEMRGHFDCNECSSAEKGVLGLLLPLGYERKPGESLVIREYPNLKRVGRPIVLRGPR